MGLEVALLYRSPTGRVVTLGAVEDPRVVESVRDQVINQARFLARVIGRRDPVLSALKELEAERVTRVAAAIETAEDALFEDERALDASDGKPPAGDTPSPAVRLSKGGRRSFRVVPNIPEGGNS